MLQQRQQQRKEKKKGKKPSFVKVNKKLWCLCKVYDCFSFVHVCNNNIHL